MNRLWIVVGAILAAALWLWDHDTQVKARVLFAQRDSARADSVRVLTGERKVLTGALDSMKALRPKLITRFETVAESVWADTVRLPGKADTLYLPASAVTAVVAACRPIITLDDRISSTCEEIVKKAVAEARLQDARREDTREQQQGFLRRHLALTAGYGAVLADSGRVRHGPSLTVGWKLWP